MVFEAPLYGFEPQGSPPGADNRIKKPSVIHGIGWLDLIFSEWAEPDIPSLGRHTQELCYTAHRFYVCVCQLVELLEYALDDSAVFTVMTCCHPYQPPKIMSQLSNYFSDLYLHETRIFLHVSCHFWEFKYSIRLSSGKMNRRKRKLLYQSRFLVAALEINSV